MCALLVAAPVGADAIYKSVDAEGRVSYSTQPTSQGREPAIELRVRTGPDPVTPGGADRPTPQVPPPPPAPGVGRGANQGANQGARQGTRSGADGATGQGSRQAGSQNKSRVQAAQLAVIQAKATLEQAKIHSPEDWQTTPSGDQVSTLAYDQRVSAAEVKVRAAETALDRLRKP